jgi:hypothetical protein
MVPCPTHGMVYSALGLQPFFMDGYHMAEDKKEPWLNYLALTTVILAVCATFSTFKGGGYSTQRILNQGQASDMWAQYQAKSIKGYIYQMNKEKLELDLKALGAKAPAEIADAYNKKIDAYGKEILRYEDDKKSISDKAKAFEAARDNAQARGGIFGLAIIYLQVAILLCSIAALMKKKPLWMLGSAVGLVGVVYFLDGFFLFF